MTSLSHSSAKPSHYTKAARKYDAFNESNSKSTNELVENILKRYKVKTVLDLTCGTGSQVLWLAKRGYEVVGSDINSSMLRIARDKAKKEKLDVKLIEEDMCTAQLGKFDAVITIFNAIGHLTKADFERAIQNIRENLKKDGLYVFDIFNLSYLLKDNNITTLTIDWQEIVKHTTIRTIQYSTISPEGILASFTTSFAQTGPNKPTISRNAQTLQIYTAEQLKEILHSNGFKVLSQSGIDGSRFVESKTERIVTVAKKL